MIAVILDFTNYVTEIENSGQLLPSRTTTCGIYNVRYELDRAQQEGFTVSHDFATDVCALYNHNTENDFFMFFDRWGTVRYICFTICTSCVNQEYVVSNDSRYWLNWLYVLLGFITRSAQFWKLKCRVLTRCSVVYNSCPLGTRITSIVLKLLVNVMYLKVAGQWAHAIPVCQIANQVLWAWWTEVRWSISGVLSWKL